jgi:hypothetical protein
VAFFTKPTSVFSPAVAWLALCQALAYNSKPVKLWLLASCSFHTGEVAQKKIITWIKSSQVVIKNSFHQKVSRALFLMILFSINLKNANRGNWCLITTFSVFQ